MAAKKTPPPDTDSPDDGDELTDEVLPDNTRPPVGRPADGEDK
jgi:hypothetical protein